VPRAFHCADAAACVDVDGTQGKCEPNGYCSFPDPDCLGSLRKYGRFADGLSGHCVDAADVCGAVGEVCCANDQCAVDGAVCQSMSMPNLCVGCVTQLAIGDGHGCALKRNGTMACWGMNDHGQLGSGGTAFAAAATPVLDNLGMPVAGITAITAGTHHTCALLMNRTMQCWGDDSAGQLGRGGNSPINSVPAPIGLNTIVSIAAGARHTCAAIGTGEVYCWGANDAGQIGGTPSAGSSSPVEVVDMAGLALHMVAVGAGATHSCGIKTDSSLWCWGSNTNGELGDGAVRATSPPAQANSLGTRVRAVAAGAHFTCALLDDESIDCVGLNDRGQAGQAPGMLVPVPRQVANIDLLTAVSASGTQACARRSGGKLICWGDAGAGGLPTPIRDGVGPIGAGISDVCSGRADGVDCNVFLDPHLACP
jgi:hypothetical protein